MLCFIVGCRVGVSGICRYCRCFSEVNGISNRLLFLFCCLWVGVEKLFGHKVTMRFSGNVSKHPRYKYKWTKDKETKKQRNKEKMDKVDNRYDGPQSCALPGRCEGVGCRLSTGLRPRLILFMPLRGISCEWENALTGHGGAGM